MGCAHFVRRTLGGVTLSETADRITLSRSLVKAATEPEVFNTITHEIAHVKVGIRAGHGPVWFNAARRLGCTGETTHDIKTDELAPFMFKCRCGIEHKWYKRSKNMHRKLCAKCREPLRWMSGAEYGRIRRMENA